MRTFNTGGVAGDDIIQGLPRVQELFEARNPDKSNISPINGKLLKLKKFLIKKIFKLNIKFTLQVKMVLLMRLKHTIQLNY